MNHLLTRALLLSIVAHAGALAALRFSAPDRPPPAPPLAARLQSTVDGAPLRSAPVARPPAPALATKSAAPPRLARSAPPAAAVAAPVPASAPPVPGDGPPAPALPTAVPATAPLPAPASLRELPRYDAAYLANPPPRYPASARRRGSEGTVAIEARVGLAGELKDVRLAASAGDDALDQAALEAVRGWRFVPARRGDEPVEAWVRIPVVFRLN